MELLDQLSLRGIAAANDGVDTMWFEGDRYETLAICRTLALARAVFTSAVTEKPGRFMIRLRAGANGRNEERARPYNLLIGWRTKRRAQAVG